MNIKPIVLATLAFFSAMNCSFAQSSKVQLPKMDSSVGQYAYLRDKLPEETIAYIRVSHPVVHFFSAKNRTNDSALLHKSSVNTLKDFREVLSNKEKFTQQIQQLGLNFSEDNLKIINYISAILYQDLNGPIEGIIRSENRTFSLMAQGLISVPVNIKSIDEFNRILADNPFNSEIKVQLDQNGYATHDIASFYFNPKEHKVFISLGFEPSSLETMQRTLTSLKTEKNHEMYAFENQIDLTGQSNFFWVDLRNKDNLLMLSQENPAAFSILKQIDGIAAGEGTNQEKQGQLKLVIKTNSQKLLGLNPKEKNDFSFKTIGEPKGAVILPMPSVTMVKKIIETYVSTAMPNISNEMTDVEIAETTENLYQEFQKEWIKHLGFDFAEILEILGANMTFYYDDLGVHSVLSIRDKKKLYNWLEQKQKQGVLTYKKDHKIHHVTLRNPLLKLLQQEDLSKPEYAGIAVSYPFINEYFANIYNIRALDLNWHLYWSEEGDYIRISSLPQIVEEERKLGNKRFDHWLTDKQGVNSQDVLFAATIDWKNADRHWYYNYLQFLQNSADILGSDFDITKMPRADQLPFDESSRLGLQVTSNNHFLTFSLDYGSDHNSGFASSLFLPAMIAPLAEIFDSIPNDSEEALIQ